MTFSFRLVEGLPEHGSVGGKKFTTAHECPLHISTKGSLPRFIGLRGKEEGSILFEHTTYSKCVY
jgi:hypothetical protein